VIAPWREWDIVSREDAIAYAARRTTCPSRRSTTKIYSRDRNIWHISHEGGALEDPKNAAPDDIWMLTRSPREDARHAYRSDHRLRTGASGFGERPALSAVALLETLNASAASTASAASIWWRIASSA
jgi:argininosuccinate synthase